MMASVVASICRLKSVRPNCSYPLPFAKADNYFPDPGRYNGDEHGPSSLGSASSPALAAFRQANRCWGLISYRRATSETTAPARYDSATIRPFCSSLERRRRPTPVRISTRPPGREVSNISSTIYVNRSRQDDPHLQIYQCRRKARSKDRLR